MEAMIAAAPDKKALVMTKFYVDGSHRPVLKEL
jgi:hypothetical protein